MVLHRLRKSLHRGGKLSVRTLIFAVMSFFLSCLAGATYNIPVMVWVSSFASGMLFAGTIGSAIIDKENAEEGE